MKYHLMAFVIGFLMDQIIGDPMNFPHPIRLIGNLIHFLDEKLLGDVKDKKRNEKSEFLKGILLCIVVITVVILVTGTIMFASYKLHPYLGIAIEAILTCYILAAKSLRDESMKVYDALENKTIEDARYAVSMIVGRDTAVLDEKGITKAAVETVAENTSDGVIAPLIYTFIGGPVLGFAYKAVNTMDSMVGYHNDRYEHLGTAAARLDDVVNFLPARISGLLMILAAFISGPEYSGKGAYRIFIRDRFNHKSPNSAQTEAACAGALSIRLAGDASYFGKIVKKPFIGDDGRPVETKDIKRACRLMFNTEYLCMAILLLLGVIYVTWR
ncbi:MAG: adenosylcobinamide-phosphate synthase CbiB [Butyrivibrio sp.]|nr:adenosylcobinamide-phosphate synthase CbiB [Butyrivibrio sp.]